MVVARPRFRVTFKYHDKLPTSEGGGGVRFPFEVDVDEKTSAEGGYEKVLELAVASVKFNKAAGLTDADFKQPQRGKKPGGDK